MYQYCWGSYDKLPFNSVIEGAGDYGLENSLETRLGPAEIIDENDYYIYVEDLIDNKFVLYRKV